MFQALKTVYYEEGARKLWTGGLHPRFMFNLMNGLVFLYFYDRFTIYVQKNIT